VGGRLLWRHAINPLYQRLPFVANREVVPFHEHLGFDPEVPIMVLGNGILPGSSTPAPFVEEYAVYIPMAFLAYHFDRFLFWDEYAGVLTVTTHEEMLVFRPDDLRYYINGFPHFLDNPVLRVDGNIFIPACLAEGLYPITVQHNEAYNIVVIENALIPYTRGEVTSRAYIRYSPDNRSPISSRVQSGSEIIIFEESDDGSFTRIRSEDGILGWVSTNSISVREDEVEAPERETILDDFINFTARRPSAWASAQPVMVAWDNISEAAVNYARMEAPLYDSINVISPTWFRLDNVATGVVSIGSREYTAWAQAEGVQVWPMFEVSASQTNALLTNRATRERIITQLARIMDELNVDGINIDFGPNSPAEGPYFIQFLRELSLRLGMRRAVLSVNVAAQETAFYSRELLAYTVDFVVIMALDEHGQNAEFSGPVASLPFVQENVEGLLMYIPPEQIVLGLPFYNRIWREVIGNNTLETRQTRHFGTAYTREWFEYNDVAWEWLPVIGSYYGSFAAHEGDEIVYYRVWLECGRSLSEKMQIFVAQSLGGVAVWNRNFRHNEELWDVMAEYMGR